MSALRVSAFGFVAPIWFHNEIGSFWWGFCGEGTRQTGQRGLMLDTL